jgi:REP element-mobilizing transposase RayT
VRVFAVSRHNNCVQHYERRLPHWDVIGQPVFVTFRLHDSLPANRVFPPQQLTTGKAFVALDRILDNAAVGPKYLAIPEIAKRVVAALRDGDRRFHRYQLHSYVVMPNHVHALVTPSVYAAKWLGPLKGFTAYEANRILGRSGNPFWQHEGYDHLVRSDEEFGRIRRYIENNPASAGLVSEPQDFEWSSASAPPERAAAATIGGPTSVL